MLRERHILLRIPDCTQRQIVRIDRTNLSQAPASWMARFGLWTPSQLRGWTRPRMLLVGAIGILATLVAIALLAGKASHGPSHASEDRFRDDLEAPGWGPSDSYIAHSRSSTSAANELDEAPAFSAPDAERMKANQPATIDRQPTPPQRGGPQSAPSRAGSAPAAQRAHVEQRIDRVPVQF